MADDILLQRLGGDAVLETAVPQRLAYARCPPPDGLMVGYPKYKLVHSRCDGAGCDFVSEIDGLGVESEATSVAGYEFAHG